MVLAASLGPFGWLFKASHTAQLLVCRNFRALLVVSDYTSKMSLTTFFVLQISRIKASATPHAAGPKKPDLAKLEIKLKP